MGGRGLRTTVQPTKLAHMSRPYRGPAPWTSISPHPALERIAGSDPPLDTIAHGLYFGEGPVWDRRNSRFLWTDIIGDTIWQWTPGVGKQVVIHPSSHANGMTFDREGRLVVAGWSARTISARGERRLARDHRLPLPGKEVQQSKRYRRAFRRQRVLDGLGRRPRDSRHGRRRPAAATGYPGRVSPHAARRGETHGRGHRLSQRIVLQPGRVDPLCQRHAARSRPRLRRQCRWQRAQRRVFHTLHRHRGRRSPTA